MQGVLPPDQAWRRLRDMHDVVEHQPAIAHALRCLTLFDQLELTRELLRQKDSGWECRRPRVVIRHNG